jgi:hypothetical protein
MKKSLVVLVFVLSFMGTSQAAKLIPPNDFTYLGAFQLPQGGEYPNSFDDGADTITFNPLGNLGNGSLFVEGHGAAVAEISIPTPVCVNSSGTVVSCTGFTMSVPPPSNLSNIPAANVVQDFFDPSNGTFTSGTLFKMSITYVPQTGPMSNPRLFWLAGDFYNYTGRVGWDGPLSALPGTVDATWTLTGVAMAQYFSYSFMAPQSWADTYTSGRSLIIGADHVNGGGSVGPSFYAIAPWAVGDHPSDSSALTSTLLGNYTFTHPVNGYGHSNNTHGAAWVNVGAKKAIVISYHRGLRGENVNPGTGDGLQENFLLVPWPYETYKGSPTGTGCNGMDYCPECAQYQANATCDPKGGPYTQELLFYDPYDLAAVAQATKQPYEIQPYARWNPSAYFFKPGDTTDDASTIGGIAYDPTNQILYVVERHVINPGSYPLIHAWHVTDSEASSVSTSPPAPPANVQHTAGSVSWSASTNTIGGMSYVVLKHYGANGSNNVTCSPVTGDFWKPVVITKHTSWTDPYYTATDGIGYQLSDGYQVAAIDQLMNFSLDYGGADTTPPTVSVTTSSPQTITSDSLTITGSCSDGAAKWRLASEPDGSNGTGCTMTGTDFSCATSGYASGSNTVYVECYDDVPNFSSGNSVSVMYNPPTVAKASSINGKTINNTRFLGQ